ncbi:hypothetical protein [Streptomyces sp. NPDC059176]|uniref:hypothetical protein n=1 Tax=unclassified Streptomyces TaxID=2593676 RepID=UPI0036CE2B88
MDAPTRAEATDEHPRRLRLPHAAQAIKVTRRRRDLNSGKIQIEHVCAVTGHDAFSATTPSSPGRCSQSTPPAGPAARPRHPAFSPE